MKIQSDIQCDSNTPVNPGYVWLQFNPVTGQFGVEAKPDGGVIVNLTFSATGVLRVGNGFQMVGYLGQHIFRPADPGVGGGSGAEVRTEYDSNLSFSRVFLAAKDYSSNYHCVAALEASGDNGNGYAKLTATTEWSFGPRFESHATGGEVDVATPINTKTVFGQSIFGYGDISTPGKLLTILSGAARTLYNNVRTRNADTSIVSSAPNMYSSTGVVSALYPVTWEVSPSSGACVFAYSGGNAVYLGASDGVWFPSTTYNSSTGQADLYWRAETECDGANIVFGVSAWNGDGPRFIVDGVYYSLSGMANTSGIGAGGGTVYVRLSFADAAKRRITIEGRYDIKLVSVRTANNAACTRPADNAATRMVFVGDSNAAMYGYDTKGDSYAMVLADCLGIRNAQMSSIYGTGLQATNGGANYNYAERIIDVTNATGADIVIFAMSWNDWNYGSGWSAAQIKTAAASLITATRAAHHDAVILFVGVTAWDIAPADETGLDGHEAAVQEAVAEANNSDPFVGFIPVRSAAGDPILYGGSTTVGTHANRYVNTSIDHLTPDGNRYVGRWLADRVFEKLVEMSGGEAPAILPPPAPASGIGSSSGLSTGVAIAMKTVRF